MHRKSELRTKKWPGQSAHVLTMGRGTAQGVRVFAQTNTKLGGKHWSEPKVTEGTEATIGMNSSYVGPNPFDHPNTTTQDYVRSANKCGV